MRIIDQHIARAGIDLPSLCRPLGLGAFSGDDPAMMARNWSSMAAASHSRGLSPAP